MNRPGSYYMQQNEPIEINGLIVEFTPIIRYMAQKLSFRLPPSMDIEDLIHAGVIGLMDAIGKYNPSKEAQFKTYAEFRIRGAMLDEIRSLDWVPRSVREKIGLLRKAFEKLANRLGRAPSEEEVTQELNMDQDQYETFMFQAKPAILFSLEDLGWGDEDGRAFFESIPDKETKNPFLSALSEETRSKLVRAIRELPEKEKWVISLYYDEELTMKEIGQAMRLTESRVCQLHAQAILRLKAKLRDLGESSGDG